VASRCLHCDCAASGNCALQSYAQAYDVDASRYRQHRRKFEKQVQPGGVTWEPGKCIQCGVCVKLTELGGEILGLTFTGRGFDVRVRAPFASNIAEGLQKVARECVDHCPTGALTRTLIPTEGTMVPKPLVTQPVLIGAGRLPGKASCPRRY
jgi:NADH dehydrogenase/NADH:ubiquinone oxidoreductase subunit G